MSRFDTVTPDEITMIIGVRLHEGNPWIVERLKLLSSYYLPKPIILIVDFGSQGEYKDKISSICREYGYKYLYVEDIDTYSAAIAHNRGFEASDTPLVFFSDIDFFFERTIFSRLAETAAALRMKSNVDTFLDFTAYHLTESATRGFFEATSSHARSQHLSQIGYYGTLEKQGLNVEFIAPYSNVYLMNRNLYSITGGYREVFRGHGSEDFEFFSRIAVHTKIHPLPQELDTDKYGPTKKDFFWVKQYRGFRRLNEILALPTEFLGLKAFHLWHPTGGDNDWREQNDWRRERFREVVSVYETTPERLLEVDDLVRDKVTICICKQPEHYGYFSPLRAHGYKIIPIYDDSPESIEKTKELILKGEVNAFGIFNPYMKSHSAFYPLFLLAKETGLKTIVVERGALPGTIYYSSDVSYAAEEFSDSAYLVYSPTKEEEAEATEIIDRLRSGLDLLEKSGSYADTTKKYSTLTKLNRFKCLIPLQLSDDMAVTKYVRKSQNYADFVKSINKASSENPDILFIVKNHPLNKISVEATPENVILADSEDNIHALIDAVDAVICYNSGVGLLSLIHQKPTVTVGNAFYNKNGIGEFANNLMDAISKAREKTPPIYDEVVRLVSWFNSRLYSNFVATDVIKEFANRKAHAYKDILITRLVIDGKKYDLGRASALAARDSQGYVYSKMNVPVPSADKSADTDSAGTIKNPEPSTVKDARSRVVAKKKKLLRDPYRYFKDAKSGFVRPLRLLFPNNFVGRANHNLLKKVIRP